MPIGCVILAASLGALGWALKRLLDFMRESASDRADLRVHVAAIEAYLWTPGSETVKRQASRKVAEGLRAHWDVPDMVADALRDVYGD